MSAPRVVSCRARVTGRPGRPAAGRRDPRPQRRGPARRHRVPAAGRRGRGRARRRAAGGLELAARGRQGRGRAARGRGRARALFDQVRTCDNHCEFCFIYQLPPGMRKSLYLKDDDYRLSFLYGNFTTLTRFTEADLERVVTERLSPLHVSHPRHRPRGARRPAAQPAGRHEPALAAGAARPRHRGPRPDRGVPGRQRRRRARRHARRGARPVPRAGQRSCVVPLGVSRYNTEPAMRPHTVDEAARRGRLPSHDWQDVFLADARPPPGVRRRRVLPAGRPAVPRRRRPTRASPCTRTASAWPAPSSSSSPARSTEPTGRASPASSPGSTAPRPRATGRLAPPTATTSAVAVLRRPGPTAPPPCRCRRGATRPSASSPAPTAPRCSARSSPASAATTSA